MHNTQSTEVKRQRNTSQICQNLFSNDMDFMDSPTFRDLVVTGGPLENVVAVKGIAKDRTVCLREIQEDLQGICWGFSGFSKKKKRVQIPIVKKNKNKHTENSKKMRKRYYIENWSSQMIHIIIHIQELHKILLSYVHLSLFIWRNLFERITKWQLVSWTADNCRVSNLL